MDPALTRLQVDHAALKRELMARVYAHEQAKAAVVMLEQALRFYAQDDCARQALTKLEALRTQARQR
jgi:hypothetical protein